MAPRPPARHGQDPRPSAIPRASSPQTRRSLRAAAPSAPCAPMVPAPVSKADFITETSIKTEIPTAICGRNFRANQNFRDHWSNMIELAGNLRHLTMPRPRGRGRGWLGAGPRTGLRGAGGAWFGVAAWGGGLGVSGADAGLLRRAARGTNPPATETPSPPAGPSHLVMASPAVRPTCQQMSGANQKTTAKKTRHAA